MRGGCGLDVVSWEEASGRRAVWTPTGSPLIARGVNPWDATNLNYLGAPTGRHTGRVCRPVGAPISPSGYPGLTPRAIDGDPVGVRTTSRFPVAGWHYTDCTSNSSTRFATWPVTVTQRTSCGTR